MNILIPHKWLLEHLDTDASPTDIQRLVSLSGPSIERIYERPVPIEASGEGDSVYDIEVTTNRVDSMSVRGIARECAVILQHAGISAKLKPLKLPGIEANTDYLPEPTIVNDETVCKRVAYVILKDVRHTPTPDWMAKRLTQVEIGVHDSVIDITNYITHELGHPCHAFDYDKIMSFGGEIYVKIAEKGKPFTTLDGMEYETVGGEIVFENQRGEIIDLPAIKGTLNTSIDDHTQNVLLWIESLDPQKVRFGSMSHAIRTVAAQLNEKNVDPELAMDVLQKGVELYQELCDAKIASEVYDEYPGKREMSEVVVHKATIDEYLGIELESDTITHILQELGCHVEDVTTTQQPNNSTTFHVIPPTFRPDLMIPADIVEEVARIYGYHNLPSVIMPGAIPLQKQSGVDFDLETKIKHFLADISWQEIYSYSMVSESLAIESGTPLEAHLKLQNPLTDDRVYLRTSLIPSLNEAIDNNPMTKELSVFEIANVYYKHEGNLPHEVLILGMVSNLPFRQVKGALGALLGKLHIHHLNVEMKHPEIPSVADSSVITTHHNGETVELGTLSILRSGRVAIQLNIGSLIRVAKNHPTYQPIVQTAVIVEDLTFTYSKGPQIGPLLIAIGQVSSLIQRVDYKGEYKSNGTFTIAYQDPARNLSSVDLEPIRKKIVKLLEEEYNAVLVGKLA